MKTVGKAMQILEILVASYEPLKIKDICEQCDINRASAYKMLAVLCEYGYVNKVMNNSRYQIGPKLLDVHGFIVRNTKLGPIALPYMEHLYKKCEQSINLMMLLGKNGYYVTIIEHPDGDPANNNHVGSTDYLHATALGKAMMAYLPRDRVEEIIESNGLDAISPNTITDKKSFLLELDSTRSRGYAIDDQEARLGSRCVAAPIFNKCGDVIAAISVAGVATSVPISRIIEYSSLVIDAAKGISSGL